MMCGFCLCASLFSVRNQNNTSVRFNLSEKNRGMNKETGIKSVYCFVQVQFGLKKSSNWLFLM